MEIHHSSDLFPFTEPNNTQNCSLLTLQRNFVIIRSLVFIPHENKFVIFCWCEVFFGYYFLSFLEKCHGKLPKIPGKYQMKTLVRLNKSLFLSCMLRKKPRRKRNQTVLNM